MKPNGIELTFADAWPRRANAPTPMTNWSRKRKMASMRAYYEDLRVKGRPEAFGVTTEEWNAWIDEQIASIPTMWPEMTDAVRADGRPE